jgi:hypothetical protein
MKIATQLLRKVWTMTIFLLAAEIIGANDDGEVAVEAR